MYKHLLLPVDATPLPAATVGRAMAFASAGGARPAAERVRADLAEGGDGALLDALSPAAFAN